MTADKEAFVLDFVELFDPTFMFRKLHRKYVESIYIILDFFKVSYDKARYSCNVFHTQFKHFYKFISENLRHISITPKTKFTFSSTWPNCGRLFVSIKKDSSVVFAQKLPFTEKGLY